MRPTTSKVFGPAKFSGDAFKRPAPIAPGQGRVLIWDLLTFERLMTGPITHLIYWAGLGLIVLLGFGVVGASIGAAIRDGTIEGAMLAAPMLVGGLLVTAALLLLWRGMCEFYLAVFRIADDLRALRLASERGSGEQRAGEPSAPVPGGVEL
jgi:hypothetical protein